MILFIKKSSVKNSEKYNSNNNNNKNVSIKSENSSNSKEIQISEFQEFNYYDYEKLKSELEIKNIECNKKIMNFLKMKI